MFKDTIWEYGHSMNIRFEKFYVVGILCLKHSERQIDEFDDLIKDFWYTYVEIFGSRK